jgi:aminoglycoside phosphotransferase (APT) family kinase protein
MPDAEPVTAIADMTAHLRRQRRERASGSAGRADAAFDYDDVRVEPGGLVMAEKATETAAGGPLQRSSRDPESLRRHLEAWIGERVGDPAATVSDLGGTSATGMSSDTILFTASWTGDGEHRSERLVARIAPDPHDVPVFPSYDMRRQYEAIRLVGEMTSVPVPRVRWYEPDPSITGAPFFVMERVDGQVPPDVMPYNFGQSWLYDAAPEEQRRLQDNVIGLLAELHAIEHPEEPFGFLGFDAPGDTPLRRHVAHTRAWYEFVAADGMRSDLIERAFAWVDDNWPADEGPTVLSWGDSRIGNIMFRDFMPVAVLDWEMAGLGPRELDVAWLIYSHRAFEDIATAAGLDGMPGFLRRDDVASRYEALTGYAPQNLEFYTLYDAIQWGIVFLRTGHRQIHFGERPAPDDVDELMYNREPIRRMLAGDYWN